MFKKIKEINNLQVLKNISWIFFGNVMYSLVRFVLDLFVARKLGLEENGMLNYAASLIAIATSLCGLGFSNIVTRELVVDKEREGGILCSMIVTQSIVGIFAILILQFFVRITSPNETQLYRVLFLQSSSIVFESLLLYVYWFRYKNRADFVAIARLVAFFITALWRVVVLYWFESIELYTIGISTETLLFGCILVKKFFKSYSGRSYYSFKIVKKSIKCSYPFIFGALLANIYSQTDRIMLKEMMGNSEVALYSASIRIAGALSMIPSSLIEGMRPSIMGAKQAKNQNLFLKRMRQIYSIVFWFSIAYGIGVTIFAKKIIEILYGSKYMGAVDSLAIIVWYDAFSYFGAINSMYMVAEYKGKWVQITALVGAVSNIILNSLLIPLLGIRGAAVASLMTQGLANFAMLWIIKDLRIGFYNMIKGICVRDVF